MSEPRHAGLDGLRALAVLGVVTEHSLLFPTWLSNAAHPGGTAVRLFFVLSGFLITGILLRARTAAQDRNRRHLFFAFYVRRAVRIFPVAYAAIAVMCLLSISDARAHVVELVTYTTNLGMAIRGHWNDALPHFWTLAIEEQFYLLWPAIILLTPRRAVPGAMIGACVLAMVARWWLADDWFSAMIATPARLDALAWGGVLAYFGAVPYAGTIGAALIAIGYFVPPLGTVLSETGCVLLSGAVVMTVVRRPSWTRWLEYRPLVYIGTISYGMYVWHMAIPQILGALADRGISVGFRVPEVYGPIRFVVLGSLTIAVAALSWHLFERPINDLKRYAPYRRPDDAPAPARETRASDVGMMPLARPLQDVAAPPDM
jgi:peptidoglycan/LPS O-acetylase OafA/YrhL